MINVNVSKQKKKKKNRTMIVFFLVKVFMEGFYRFLFCKLKLEQSEMKDQIEQIYKCLVCIT